METKVCKKCNQERQLEDYHYSSKKKNILKSYCKICCNVKSKARYHNNKEEYTKYFAEYYEANKERISKRSYPKDKQPGVYMFKNLITGECYIGASINPRRRVAKYFARVATRCKNIDDAVKKYPKKSFVWGVLEYCDKEVLFERETEYIKKYKPEWNTNKVK